MHRAPLALLAILAAAPLATRPASAESVRLSYGMPLGSFSAAPSGQTPGSQQPATAERAPTERRRSEVAEPPSPEPSTVRVDAAQTRDDAPATTANEPQMVETKTEADAPTAVASGENKMCRKFIATVGTTIEVPCTTGNE